MDRKNPFQRNRKDEPPKSRRPVLCSVGFLSSRDFAPFYRGL